MRFISHFFICILVLLFVQIIAPQAASLKITGVHETAKNNMDGFHDKQNEKYAENERNRDEQQKKWNSMNHLITDCEKLTGYDLNRYCKSGECSFKDKKLMSLCIDGYYPSQSFAHYINSYVKAGIVSDEFGKNKYEALRHKDSSKQIRIEFAIYHLTGHVIR